MGGHPCSGFILIVSHNPHHTDDETGLERVKDLIGFTHKYIDRTNA